MRRIRSLVTQAEAARMLGLSRPRVCDLVNRGELEIVTIGSESPLRLVRIRSIIQRMKQPRLSLPFSGVPEAYRWS